MAVLKNKYQSVNDSRFYMKLVGFWKANTASEQRMMNFVLFYAIFAIFIALMTQSVDLYYCCYLGDFHLVMDNLSASIIVVFIMIKLTSFVYYRSLIFEMIAYAEKHFWEVEYDEYGATVLKECDRKAVLFTYVFCKVVECGALMYIILPILQNPHFEKDKRSLPFKLWLNFPITTSPYYEVIYAIEIFSTTYSGICTFCFDHFLCCLNIHVAGQFKILAHKLETIADIYLDRLKKSEEDVEAAEIACSTLKNCVRGHLQLVSYVERMERAFTWILLGQLLFSSIIICFGTFQFLATESAPKKCLYVLHFVGSISQLFIYTWTCNDITSQSDALATAAYNMRWYLLPHDATGKMIKQGVFMVIHRTCHPCVLTAGKFAPMTLETFKSILGTAASYFTLLQQMNGEDI